MHGGTAIWRCYNGNRFSEDIDAYIGRDLEKLNLFFETLKRKGFFLEKKKINENSIFSTLKFSRTLIRFEALFKKVNGTLKEYEKVNGSLSSVYTLTPEELINEKIAAYLNRLKSRDLYDIFFLLRHVRNDAFVKDSLNKLIKGFKYPIDEKGLHSLILEGLTPTSEKMLNYIVDWNTHGKN